MAWRISVGRRLAAMIVVQAILVGAVIGIAAMLQRDVASGTSLRGRFAIALFEAVADALEQEAALSTLHRPATTDQDDHVRSRRLVAELVAFRARYRDEWQVAGSPSADTRRFADELRATGAGDLVEAERVALERLDRALAALQSGDPSNLPRDILAAREALHELLATNVAYLTHAQAHSIETEASAATWLVLAGAGALAASVLAGLMVRRAIAPRVRRLVRKTRRFQEFGEISPDTAQQRGADELAVLAGALDTGFQAIAARDKEREQFLAVVAHELKTPLASIVGFAQSALAFPESAPDRTRANEAIERQARRLSRLIDEILMASVLRSKARPFRPTPMDLADCARTIVDEIHATQPDRVELEAPDKAPVLADQPLVEQAMWSMLKFAFARARRETPLPVRVAYDGGTWRVRVELPGTSFSQEDLARVFEPFSFVQHEEKSQARVAAGLYYCREMARLHGGRVSLEGVGVEPAAIVLELPG